MSDFFDMPPPQPYWFVDSELLADILRAEIQIVNQLTASQPALRHSFDNPNAMEAQQKLCFTVLAHRRVLEMIYEKFAGVCETPPDLGDEETKALDSTNGLVKGDAPNWVLEMDRVVEQLPHHIISALPQPLRTEGFPHHDPTKMEAVLSAAKAFGTVEQIQAWVERALDQQLERLVSRWTVPAIEHRTVQVIEHRTVQAIANQQPKKRKFKRTRDRRREIRDRDIAEIDDVSPTITEYLQLMDERKIAPQPTWSAWPGSWKAAYKQTRLRKLIHQDKSRAISRARPKK